MGSIVWASSAAKLRGGITIKGAADVLGMLGICLGADLAASTRMVHCTTEVGVEVLDVVSGG